MHPKVRRNRIQVPIPRAKTLGVAKREKGKEVKWVENSRKINPKTHKRGHGRVELCPNVYIHVADLFVASLLNAPLPETVLQLFRGLQEGCDSFLHVGPNLYISKSQIGGFGLMTFETKSTHPPTLAPFAPFFGPAV